MLHALLRNKKTFVCYQHCYCPNSNLKNRFRHSGFIFLVAIKYGLNSQVGELSPPLLKQVSYQGPNFKCHFGPESPFSY